MVKTLVVMLVSTITGTIGWYLGALFGVMTAWMLSVVGTAIGVYYSRKWAIEYLP
jgi:ABC-type lipoprotein release transport system permease subunit